MKKYGLYIVSLTCLWLPSKSQGLTRRDWIFTQLSSSSLALNRTTSGFQISLSNLTYDSFSSTQAGVFWDSGLFELGLKTSGQLFHSLGVGRTSLNNSLSDWNSSYSFELARRFVSPVGRFGRLGIEFDEFTPSSQKFIQVALDTGILDSSDEPDLMKLSFHLFQPVHSSADTRIISSLELGRVISRLEQTVWKAGVGLGWTYHLSKEQESGDLVSASDKTLQSEHMFFSLNPHVEYSNKFFVARLTIPFRLFIDKQWQLRRPPDGSSDETLVTSYPFHLANPDAWLSITFLI